jgi:hypothetical protein
MVRRGELTGPVSRILSSINLLLGTYILVLLIKNQYYIPVIIIIFLMFTPIAPLGVLGAIIYFAIIGYWVVVLLLLVLGIVGWLSVRFGMRNVLKILTQDRGRFINRLTR